MPYRVVQFISSKSIKTPGPLTLQEATVLAKYHNDNQLAPSYTYKIESYEEDQDSGETT